MCSEMNEKLKIITGIFKMIKLIIVVNDTFSISSGSTQKDNLTIISLIQKIIKKVIKDEGALKIDRHTIAIVEKLNEIIKKRINIKKKHELAAAAEADDDDDDNCDHEREH